MNLPSGTVTFLYTDIEGSASLWEGFPEPMRAALAKHDAILRESITGHGGMVYKVIGDAFQAAFPVAVQAVRAAIAIQRELASTEWHETGALRVRMGLHTGEAIPLDDDYDTTHTLNRVARIMSAGHGGQILISQAVAELVRGALGQEVTLRDMGQHRMKGLSQLEHLSQVCIDGLPQDFPPLKTLDDHPNNLPLQLTTFVGRESEIDAVRQGLTSSRLITLLGPGGAGKTRLALEVGDRVLDECPDGVWFVELAPLQDDAVVPQAVVKAIGLREQEGRKVTEQLADYLRNKDILLILDNCEHLIDACAQFAELALRSGREVRILATSRQSLRLTSERVYSLKGMDFPAWKYPQDLNQYPAVQLFRQSARQVDANFEPQPGELETIARICQLVQGMPLAILLAAGWVDVLGLDEIAAEISRSVDFLESEMRDIPERHRSMRAVFEYSWNLLSEEEQSVFANMAVFHGGFDRRAAQEITGTSLRMLNNLVNKSLLQREAESRRFYIHEILRQLAESRLVASGQARSIREAHSCYFLDLLAKSEADLKGERQLDALDELEAEFENLRAAWTWAVENRDADRVNSSLDSLFLLSVFRSRFSEGYDLFHRARQQWPANDQQDSALAGRLLLRYPDPDREPGAIYQQGLEIARRYDNLPEVAFATNLLGRHLAHEDIDFERGMDLLEDSLSAYRQLNDEFAAARVLDDLAFGYSLRDQSKRIQFGEQSLALRRKIGDLIGVANVLRNLTVAAYWMGDDRGAERYTKEALSIARQMRDLHSIAWLRSLQAEGSLLKGDFEASRRQIEEAYGISQEVNDWDLIRNCLLIRAILISVVDEDYVHAKQLVLEAHPPETPSDMLTVQAYGAYALVYTGLGDHNQSAKYLALMIEEMARMGIGFDGFQLAIPLIAIILFQQGDLDLSAQCLGYYDHLPKGLSAWVEQWPVLVHLRQDLQANLGGEAYQDALERGKSLEFESIADKFAST
ncbi:MAG TPA: adenylate/guanylate cyclase domain-containing protein [Anaerolineales bacterium]